ncbi:hypothetical protein CE91St41_10810 [Oscillospiraceae bacterium]|nr:hypothetical protein CE91St40_26730 [Oscillospiraceae bacterium]BDF74192.1 hypothetical protein CE91St41_10810 [Oscillospiraceae bacterium]
MKQWIAGALAALFLIGTGCSAAASAPEQPVQPPAPAAPTAQAQPMAAQVGPTPAGGGALTVEIYGGSLLTVRESGAERVSFDGRAEDFSVVYGTAPDGSDTVTIRQTKKDDDADHAQGTLEIPKNAYRTVAVELHDTGTGVYVGAADYRVEADESACSVNIPSGYAGQVSFTARESACSVAFGGPVENAALTVKTEDCAFSIPDGWSVADKYNFTLVRGEGTAKISVNLRDCAASIEEGLVDLNSRYQGLPGNMALAVSSTGEAVLGSGDVENRRIFGGDGPGDWKQELEQWRANCTPNTVTPIRDIPAQGIDALRINAQLCGVAVEPSKSGNFELSYVGVEKPEDIKVETQVEDGLLTLTCERQDGAFIYVNPGAEFRVNTVRLGVPAGVLERFQVDCGTASVLIADPDAPVTGYTPNGMIRVTGDKLAHPVTMESKNGSVTVRGGEVRADVTLHAANGSVVLKANDASGLCDLSAENGSVKVEAGTLGRARLRAENGSVKAEVGTVGEDVYAGVSNGSLKFTLTRQPADLTFRLDGQSSWSRFTLPKGWEDGHTMGSGKPLLTLACENGTLNFQIG